VIWFSVNGVPSCANKKLLRRILREEWNFTGYVVSDADALDNIIHCHHYLNNTMSTAAAAVKAGCNLELTGMASGHVFDSMSEVC